MEPFFFTITISFKLWGLYLWISLNKQNIALNCFLRYILWAFFHVKNQFVEKDGYFSLIFLQLICNNEKFPLHWFLEYFHFRLLIFKGQIRIDWLNYLPASQHIIKMQNPFFYILWIALKISTILFVLFFWIWGLKLIHWVGCYKLWDMHWLIIEEFPYFFLNFFRHHQNWL